MVAAEGFNLHAYRNLRTMSQRYLESRNSIGGSQVLCPTMTLHSSEGKSFLAPGPRHARAPSSCMELASAVLLGEGPNAGRLQHQEPYSRMMNQETRQHAIGTRARGSIPTKWVDSEQGMSYRRNVALQNYPSFAGFPLASIANRVV